MSSPILGDVKKFIRNLKDIESDPPSEILDLESGLSELLAPIYNADPDKFHNPLQVEELLDQCGVHINECLRRLSEAESLQEAALNALVEERLISALNRVEEKQVEIVEHHMSTVSSAQAKQSSVEENEGRYQGTSESQLAVQDFEMAVLECQKQRNKFAAESRAILNSYMNMDGCSLNYTQRYQRSRRIFRESLKQAYAKCFAVSDGVKIAYGITDSPLPDIETGSGYVYRLYEWHQGLVEMLTGKLERDRNFTLAVSLRYGFYQKGEFHKMFDSPAAFEAVRPSRLYRFTIKEEMFSRMSHVRIRGINIRVVDEVEHMNEARFSEMWNTIITPPKQRTSQGEVINLPNLPHLAYSLKGISDASPDSSFVSEGYYNGTPVGDWMIEFPGENTRHRGHGAIKDIILELRLASFEG